MLSCQQQNYLIIAGIDVGLQVIGWLISYCFQTEKIYDLTGSLTYITVAIFSLRCNNYQFNEDNWRQLILMILVIVWAVRLGGFLFYRVIASGGDSRFDKYKSKPFAFLIVWLIQATWVYFTLFPTIVANQETRPLKLWWLDYVGIGVWTIGFFCECLADYQKWKFKQNPDNKGKFISTGIWSISRHPNYFGEITLWIGVFLICARTFEGWEWVSVLSPLFIICLICFVSGLPQLETSGMERYGGKPEYQEYLRKVPVLVPFVPSCYKGSGENKETEQKTNKKNY